MFILHRREEIFSLKKKVHMLRFILRSNGMCNDIFDINDQILENKYSYICNVSIIIISREYYPFLSPRLCSKEIIKKRKEKHKITTNYVKLFAR